MSTLLSAIYIAHFPSPWFFSPMSWVPSPFIKSPRSTWTCLFLLHLCQGRGSPLPGLAQPFSGFSSPPVGKASSPPRLCRFADAARTLVTEFPALGNAHRDTNRSCSSASGVEFAIYLGNCTSDVALPHGGFLSWGLLFYSQIGRISCTFLSVTLLSSLGLMHKFNIFWLGLIFKFEKLPVSRNS